MRELYVQESYNLHLKISSQFSMDINKYILIKLFDINQSYVIKKALFPYKLPNYIKHYCLWVNPIHERFWSYNSCKYIAKTHFGNKVVHFFRNKYEDRSIKKITHYHIFVEVKL